MPPGARSDGSHSGGARSGGAGSGGAQSGGAQSGRARSGGAGSGGARSGGARSGGSPVELDAGESTALTLFERTFGTPHGASIEQLAGAFGIPYTLAVRPGDVAKAVAATVPGTGPRIVEARTGRAANADLRARMQAAAIRAAAAAAG
jgi:hypothetical protein